MCASRQLRHWLDAACIRILFARLDGSRGLDVDAVHRQTPAGGGDHVLRFVRARQSFASAP